MSNVMVAGRHSWHNFLNDDGDLSCYQLVLLVWCSQGLRGILFSMKMVGMVMLILLVASGPSWYNILHNDGSDGDVGIVGRLRAIVA